MGKREEKEWADIKEITLARLLSDPKCGSISDGVTKKGLLRAFRKSKQKPKRK